MQTATVTDIDASDINDLNTVNAKCENNIKKNPSKYLLNTDNKFSRCGMKESVNSKSSVDKCENKSKNKIIFGDENEVLITPSVSETAIKINDADLCKLKTVYAKCKAVVKEIDSKYGYLLNIDSKDCCSRCGMTKTYPNATIIPHKEGGITLSSNNFNPTDREIFATHLSKLKKIYTECKEVVEDIDSKYSQVLNVDDEECSSQYLIKKSEYSGSHYYECFIKSSVFDDTGEIPISCECDGFNETTTDNVTSDLNKLKTGETEFEEAMKAIEYKYEHNLSLTDIKDGSCGCLTRALAYSEKHECPCKYKNNIVDGDERRQSAADMSDIHVCVQGTVPSTNNVPTSFLHGNGIVKYKNSELQLPVTLPELRELLNDPGIEDILRLAILNKIKSRLLYLKYEIKVKKGNLIRQLKKNPDDVFDFTGSNLSLLSGYKP